jgi:hypothetical protein
VSANPGMASALTGNSPTRRYSSEDGRNIRRNTDSKLGNLATDPLRKINLQPAKSSEAYVIKLRCRGK